MTLIAEAITAKLPDHYWTLEQYHAMIEAGILTSADRVELLYGKVVPSLPSSPLHSVCNSKISRLVINLLDHNYVVGVKSPVTLNNDTETEPDITISRGPIERDLESHPTADDIFLLIEVSDTTLNFDRKSKKTAYAMAGIQEYWIVNVFEREIERFTNPHDDGSYANHQVHQEGEEITSLHLGSFQVADLLP